MSSYTIPYFESKMFDKAQCDLFGAFVEAEHKFLAASNTAIFEIERIRTDLDDVLLQESQMLDIVAFTLLATLTMVVICLGCCCVTDSQRLRLVSVIRAAVATWNRFTHRNRVYDVGTSGVTGQPADTHVSLREGRCDACSFVISEILLGTSLALSIRRVISRFVFRAFKAGASDRLFEKFAIAFMLVFMIVLLVNAACFHAFVVPSLIMGGPAFDHFESSMEFLAAEMSPKLLLADTYTYVALGLFGLKCNKSMDKPFFGMTSPQKLVDSVNLQLDSFDAAHQSWSMQVEDFPELKFGLEALRSSGRPVADTFRDQIAPLVLAQNFSAALLLTESVLCDQLGEHESIASELSMNIDLLYSNTLSLASYGRDTSLWFIYGISAMLFATVAFVSSLLIRDASVYKLELSDVASDPASVLHSVIPKLANVHEKQQAAMSQRSMMIIFSLVTLIQILGIALPIRFLGDLVQQSPIANQVGRLDVMLVRDAYIARELFLSDDLTAMVMVRLHELKRPLHFVFVVAIINCLTCCAGRRSVCWLVGTQQQKSAACRRCKAFERFPFGHCISQGYRY